MTETIKFTLDDKPVTAKPGESIWQAAKREGVDIPHLCYKDAPGYSADGNCRACMVEIEGERVLAPSCARQPESGMVVKTASERAVKSRKMVMELLLADQPEQAKAHDAASPFWRIAKMQKITQSRFPARTPPAPDNSHPAMAVQLDACIHCNLCNQACRDVQVNDVIGMGHRGAHSKIIFDLDDTMLASTCVACGECVEACPTGALMPANLVDENGIGTRGAEREVQSICPYCGVGCQITYKIRDEKIAYVEGANGPSNENRLCVKGRFGFDYVDHKERLTKPLIRLEGKPKGPAGDLDPANYSRHFREASWDEALDLAVNGLKKARDENGSAALAGLGSAKCSNEEAYLFQKLIRAGFGTNNVDHCTRLCHASSVAALMETIGSGAVTAPFNSVDKTDVIIVIGSNATENHPVAASYFRQAVKRGAQLIVMDPRGQALKRHASHMLQFKPGSDVAMLNAIMHVIVEEALYDKQYVQAHTEGFDKLKNHLSKFTPEAMADICDVAPEKLREVARVYASAKSAIIFWGMGVTQHIHGTDNARCLISLALMTGQIGRPGTGLHPLRGQNNVQGASDAGLIPMMLPNYGAIDNDAIREKFENLWGVKLDPEPGLTVVEIVDAIHEDRINAMYIMGENPAMSDPNVAHARHALAKLDHLVVQDIFLTETAAYADVILPAAAWPEKDGTVTNTNRQVQLGRRALAAPGEAKPDWWIIQEMAIRFGLDWAYTHPKDVFAEMGHAMASLDNITWERLEVENSVTYPCEAPDQPGKEIVFGDGFPTPSGLGLFSPADIVAPDEAPDDEYPMVLTTGRQLEHWHTGAISRRSITLDALEPVASAALNPDDLKALGVEPGEMVAVSTRRGRIELMARADHAIARGLVFVPFAYVEAAANLLTNPKLDPFGKIPELKYSAAKVDPL